MKIIIFSSEDWHFVAHLMPIAQGAQNLGHEVEIVTKVTSHGEQIINNNLKLTPINLSRFSLNPFTELKVILQLIKIYKLSNPDILHHFGLKPILYGSIANIFLKKTKIINTFLGMGFVFISDKLWVRAIRLLFVILLKMCMRRSNAIIVVQNEDDRELISRYHLVENNNVITQCSVGINCKQYPFTPKASGIPIFALVARMIWDKGIAEFISAIKIIKAKGLQAEFWLVGAPDPNNSRSIPTSQLQALDKLGIIKWMGHCDDITAIWQKVSVAVLPSYREGLSRSLLEAAASGCAIITTDAPGCRTLVQDMVNGLLVKVKDVETLVNAIEKLIHNTELRHILALQAKEQVEKYYSEDIIVNKMLALYKV